MKTITLFISFMLCAFYYAHAQRLVVTYEESSTLQRPQTNLSQSNDPRIRDNPQIRAAIESQLREMNMGEMNMSRTSQLIVNNGISIYKPEAFEQTNNRATEGSAGNTNIMGNVQTRLTTAASTTTYKNHLDKQMVDSLNFEGKEYLIEEPLTEYRWNIRRNRKEISGFQCIEARTRTSRGANVIAWYTPDIPVSDGPSSYWGLPGLILYLDIDNGNTIISCTSIAQVDDLPAIELPNQGEKISRAEFEKMMTERMERMRGEPGRSGTVIIR